MKKIIKSIISMILVLGIMLSTAVTAFAAYEIEEEYLSDLRLIYANTYTEAKQIFNNSKLEGYEVLNHNLNANSGEIGVWLAYKVTTNIDDAITDVAIMQMGGGYSAANYQTMIEQLRDEYLAMGEVYLQAVDYFAEAYVEGDFLAESAYRQLNFYAGFDKYPEDRLGDLFTSGDLRKNDLADLFFESNANVSENLRTLLAMGVSYNDDGLNYLERVGKLVAKLGQEKGIKAFSDSDVEIYVYSDSELKTLSRMIAPNIIVFRSMLEELSVYERSLEYTDNDFTALELKYAEYKALAEKLRAVYYINGQTLYDFCRGYAVDTSDYSSLYPLAAALNEGQIAMTQLAHYYDVVRYSMSDYPETLINDEIARIEERYAEKPFDVYFGVDRSLIENTFALTPNANRINAYDNRNSLGDCLFGGMNLSRATLAIDHGITNTGLSIWAVVRAGGNGSSEVAQSLSKKAIDKLEADTLAALEELENSTIDGSITYGAYVEKMYKQVLEVTGENLINDVKNAWNNANGLVGKTMAIVNAVYQFELPLGVFNLSHMQGVAMASVQVVMEKMKSGQPEATAATASFFDLPLIRNGLLIWGVYSSHGSAKALYDKIYNHYHPKYEDIPLIMVDAISTENGTKYVKYDVVREVWAKNGEYPAADLNAFEGERWNALYYTKNADAGKPLLAEFDVSNDINRPDKGYSPVHRFGEVICYDLNKYNFSYKSDMIFLSIEQSQNQKQGAAEVPELTGTMIGTGLLLLSGGVGIIIGAGGTLGVQKFFGRKKRT